MYCLFSSVGRALVYINQAKDAGFDPRGQLCSNMRVNAKPRPFNIIQVYMPASEDEDEEVYAELTPLQRGKECCLWATSMPRSGRMK